MVRAGAFILALLPISCGGGGNTSFDGPAPDGPAPDGPAPDGPAPDGPTTDAPLLDATVDAPVSEDAASDGSVASCVERVSVATDGAQCAGGSGVAMSADGTLILFGASGPLFPGDDASSKLYIRNRLAQTTSAAAAPAALDFYFGGTLDGDGSALVISSVGALVPDDTNALTDVFILVRGSGAYERVSITSDGSQGNHISSGLMMTPDGRHVLFTSQATNLVPDDTNGWPDMFVRDRMTATTTRISVTSTGDQPNRGSELGSISDDGRFVVFETTATNVTPGADGNATYLFLRDRVAGTTTLIATGRWPRISADGRFVAFLSVAALDTSDTNQADDIFVWERSTGAIERVSVSSAGALANRSSSYPEISGDGRFVTFLSGADNLVASDTNSAYDVFLHDRLTHQTRMVNVACNGMQGGFESTASDISRDGRWISFTATSRNLVPDDTNLGPDVFVVANPMLP